MKRRRIIFVLTVVFVNGMQIACHRPSHHEGLTGPSFCTTASERVYITTSSGKDANGGAQGAVGDRRAAICGANVAGAGGL